MSLSVVLKDYINEGLPGPENFAKSGCFAIMSCNGRACGEIERQRTPGGLFASSVGLCPGEREISRVLPKRALPKRALPKSGMCRRFGLCRSPTLAAVRPLPQSGPCEVQQVPYSAI